MPNEIPFVFIYIFLVITGGIAIIASLIKIASKNTGPSDQADSSVETVWFKFNAPAGFVYGLVAIFSVIFMVKYDYSAEYKRVIYRLEQESTTIKNENAELRKRLSINASSMGDSTFTVDVASYEPLSLFNATVMIVYDHNAFSKSILEFKGIAGVSFSYDGNYNSQKIEFKKGDRFYLKLTSGQIWGVNILREMGNATLEFFAMNNQKKS